MKVSTRIRRWKRFLSIGLVFEIASSIWALKQSVSEGAFTIPDCDLLHTAAYVGERMVKDGCTEQDEVREVFYSGEGNNYTFSNHTSCGSVVALPSRLFCDCSLFDDESFGSRSSGGDCAWTAANLIIGEGDEGLLCVATSLYYHSIEDEERSNVTAGWYLDRDRFVEILGEATCFPVHPAGFKTATSILVVVMFGAIFMEAFSGFEFWNGQNELARWKVAASSLAEAAGLTAALLVLDWSSEPDEGILAEVGWSRYDILWRMAWSAGSFLYAGAVAEICGCLLCSDAAPKWRSYFDAFGNMSIWLGAALTELVITAYVIWRQPQNAEETWGVLGSEFAGLIVAELVGVILLWTARVILTRVKLMLWVSKHAAPTDTP